MRRSYVSIMDKILADSWIHLISKRFYIRKNDRIQTILILNKNS